MSDLDLDLIEQRVVAAGDAWRGQKPASVAQLAYDASALLAEVRRLTAEVRRLTAERDALAQWKAGALPVMGAFLDLARRVVADSALGRLLPDALAEHVDRQAAALREIEALFREAQSLVSKYTRGPGENGDRVADLLTDDAYRIGADGLAILARHSGGESDG